jgi:hypothetical protein
VKPWGSLVAGLILLGAWYVPKPSSNNVLALSPLQPKTAMPVAEPAVQSGAMPIAKSGGKRLKIEVEVSSPGEVLVADGARVGAQQVIVDRKMERGNLMVQLQEVKLSIEKLKMAPRVTPVPPSNVSGLKALPRAQFLEEAAQVTAATAKLQDIQRKYAVAKTVAMAPLPESGKVRISAVAVRQQEETIRKQQQKIDALQTIEDLDPVVKQHEEAKMGQLRKALVELQAKLEPEQQQEAVARVTRSSNLEGARLEVTTAQRELDLAKARLGAAGEKRRQMEFEYQLKQNEQAGQVQRLELERVKLLETGRLQEHEREYQIAQLVLKHNQIQRQMTELAVVKVPHAGMIRRVKLVGQRGGLLRYEIVLVYVPNELGTKTNDWKEE